MAVYLVVNISGAIQTSETSGKVRGIRRSYDRIVAQTPACRNLFPPASPIPYARPRGVVRPPIIGRRFVSDGLIPLQTGPETRIPEFAKRDVVRKRSGE